MNEIVVGLLQKEDIPKIYEFMKNVIISIPYYSDEAKLEEPKQFEPEIISKNLTEIESKCLYVVAKDGDKIAGVLNGYYGGGVIWGNWLGVGKEYRRQGVAQKMIEYMEAESRKLGCHKFWCDTRTDNLEVIALQEKLGYIKVGELKDHWYHLDFYLWEKNL
ncbi:MAG: GNAT family N-acetyltransferase [Candidatus Pacebacteria bacterium]|nr:GNAT family N-acetyltransferase [Candidatus Paceibacterota bacterium]